MTPFTVATDFKLHLGGKLADVLGRKRTIIIFDLLAVMTYFLCGFIEPSLQLVWMIMFALLIIGINFSYTQCNFLIPIHVASVFGGDTGARYFGLLSSLNSCVVIAMTPILTLLLKKYKPIQVILLSGFIYMISFGTFLIFF